MQENKNELWRISEEVVKNEESRHIIITSEEESISPTGMKLNIKNCSDENVILLYSYSLQIKVNGEWHDIKIKNNEVFPTDCCELKKDQSIQVIENWVQNYGELPAGEYRILKYAYIDSVEGRQDEYATCQFKIKQKRNKNKEA